MNIHSETFEDAIKVTDSLVDPHDLTDDSVRLFHLLAGALEWCYEHNVDFDLTLEQVRESFADHK